MDHDLLIALVVLWCSSTAALIVFLSMWFFNEGEAFHPHSVAVEQRHHLFLVVDSKTQCKLDCVVKSISAFVAPRGSSSSKQFTVICVMIAVAGFLGTSRWYYVGDASGFQACLALCGYASLLFVAIFELDVVPDRFLEDKLIVTGWLIEKLGYKDSLPFELNCGDKDFLQFIRNSKEIYPLYEEDKYLKNRSHRLNMWSYHSVWGSVHMLGAILYVTLIPAAIILNDLAEEKVAWITGVAFVFFCFLGYLTGNYFPVAEYFRCWILLWNPFVREPLFMGKLKKAVEAYLAAQEQSDNLYKRTTAPLSKKAKRKAAASVAAVAQNNKPSSSLKALLKQNSTTGCTAEESRMVDETALDSVFLKFARRYPLTYLKLVGHLLVMSELIALLTPSIAMGIQWVTALCDGPPVLSIIELLILCYGCIRRGECDFTQDQFSHCILKK